MQECTYKTVKFYIKRELEKDYEIISFDNEGSSLKNLVGVKRKRFGILGCVDMKVKSDVINIEGNRGIIYCTIHDKTCDKNICLFCCHFPWRPIYDNEKAKILGKIFEKIKDKKHAHIIICGDFNSLPDSIFMRMIYPEFWKKELCDLRGKYEKYESCDNRNDDNKGGWRNERENRLMYRTLRRMLSDDQFNNTINSLFELSAYIFFIYKIRSSYENYNRKVIANFSDIINNHPEYTNWTSNFKGTIDYILYSSSSLDIYKIAKIPQNNGGFLPNEFFPSDHMKLMAVFYYK